MKERDGGDRERPTTRTRTTTTTTTPPPPSYHAHFDCFSGAAGDMMLAACLDASDDPKHLLAHVTSCLSLGMPELAGEFGIETKRVWRGGMGSIAGLHVAVHSQYNHTAAPVPKRPTASDNNMHDHSHGHTHKNPNHDHSNSHSQTENGHGHSHEDSQHQETAKPSITKDIADSVEIQSSDGHSHSHSHGNSHSHEHSSGNSHSKGPLRNLPDIKKMLENAPEDHITPWARSMAIAAFTELAKAEAKTHGAESVDTVHFHEVGAIDSIVDTVGTLIALDKLGVTSVSCSRLPLGEGTVWTQHGLLPVPAPATLRLLVGMPTCQGPPGETGELVTPTGAALLRALTLRPEKIRGIEGRPPNFTIRKIGIGAGTKDFERHPNVLRLLLGDTVVSKMN